MVTIDKIVKTVKEFDGNVKNHRTYERAKENIEVINADSGMHGLEETLRKATGYNDFHRPSEPDMYSIEKDGIQFNVKSETTTKRPQYKKAVEQMENYINGINTLLFEDRVITGIAKENDMWCVSVDKLVENYSVFIAGIKAVGVKQTITYEADESRMVTPKQMDMSTTTDGRLTAENFNDYMMKDLLRANSVEYKKAYEKELKNKEKISGIAPINTRKGYKEETTKSDGIDWAYVAKTLVNDDEKARGELNILADNQITFEDKQSMLPQYKIFVREPFNVPTIYVGIESVYDRIQELKNDRTISGERTKFIPKEIV